jgi:hypothetical protein
VTFVLYYQICYGRSQFSSEDACMDNRTRPEMSSFLRVTFPSSVTWFIQSQSVVLRHLQLRS